MLSVRTDLPLPQTLRSQPPTPPPPPPRHSLLEDVVEGAKDLKESLSLLISGSLFLHQKKKSQQVEEGSTAPLSDVPNVALSRPLVICPGWNTESHKFDYLSHKLLASGQNGDGAVFLKEGHAFRDAECSLALDKIPSNSKVFVNIWDDAKSPPEVTAPQLKENLALLHSALGPDKVDVVGYSMGGLCARKYLDDGGADVHNLMMLGTPNGGTRFGQMCARVIDRDIDWAMRFSGITPGDRPAMHWLAEGSAKLEDLNSRWPQQRARVDNAEVVGGRYLATPATGWLPFRPGDSMVEASHLVLPGMDNKILDGELLLNHVCLPHDSQVYREMERFFEFKPVGGAYSGLTHPHVHDNDTPYGSL